MEYRVYAEGYDVYLWQKSDKKEVGDDFRFHEILPIYGNYDGRIEFVGHQIPELVGKASKEVGLNPVSYSRNFKTIFLKVLRDDKDAVIKEEDTEEDVIYNLFVYELNLEKYEKISF